MSLGNDYALCQWNPGNAALWELCFTVGRLSVIRIVRKADVPDILQTYIPGDWEMNAILRWVVAPIIATVPLFFLAPKVDGTHLPSELGTFFATGATLLGTFFIALALLAVASPLAGYRIRQIVGYISTPSILLWVPSPLSVELIVAWPYAGLSLLLRDYDWIWLCSAGGSHESG